MAVRRRAEAVRLDIPRLEPDDAFVERLASAARASRPSAAARRHLQGLRVGLATAGVVGLTVGGAWAAGNLVEREDQAPGRTPATESNPPISPDTTPSTPDRPSTPVEPSTRRGGHDGAGDDGRHRGRPDHPGERGQGQGRHVGRPDEHPAAPHGHGRGRDQQGRPSELPAPGERGQGADRRDERADPGGPKGPGDRRRPDSPR